MKTANTLLVLNSLLLLTACGQRAVYAEYAAVPDSGWMADSMYVFSWEVTDTAQAYDVLIHLRHKDNYPYQNLWLFVEQAAYNIESQPVRDTIELYLADDHGRWLGSGGNGLLNMPVLYRQSYHFPAQGVYTLTIQQGMRTDLLRGMSDVGVEVRAAEGE